MRKVTVEVETVDGSDGLLLPVSIIWNKKKVKIDRVLYYSKAAEGEFTGIRYTVVINGFEKYLYRTDDGWYVVCDQGER